MRLGGKANEGLWAASAAAVARKRLHQQLPPCLHACMQDTLSYCAPRPAGTIDVAVLYMKKMPLRLSLA